jgi:hypothetical protein
MFVSRADRMKHNLIQSILDCSLSAMLRLAAIVGGALGYERTLATLSQRERRRTLLTARSDPSRFLANNSGWKAHPEGRCTRKPTVPQLSIMPVQHNKKPKKISTADIVVLAAISAFALIAALFPFTR